MKNKNTMSEAKTLIPPLPNDVAMSCLARVPRRYHGVLSAVSKPIKALLTSPEFFAVRSRLGVSEKLLCVRRHSVLYVVHRNPTKLAPLPPPPGGYRKGSAVAALGHSIYLVGGEVSNVPSSDVWVLDCRTGTWSRGPATLATRLSTHAAVLEGTIYVLGGTNEGRRLFGEVLEPGKRWKLMPELPGGINREMTRVDTCVAAKGRVQVFEWGSRGRQWNLNFDPKTQSWGWGTLLWQFIYDGHMRLDVGLIAPRKNVMPGEVALVSDRGFSSFRREGELCSFEAWCKETKVDLDGTQILLLDEPCLSWSGQPPHQCFANLTDSWACFPLSL